jgi:soluble lytic murein transglycosylase-like protein
MSKIWIWISIWMLLAGSALAQTAPPAAATKEAAAPKEAAAAPKEAAAAPKEAAATEQAPAGSVPPPLAQPPPLRTPPTTSPPAAAGMREALQKQRQSIRRQAELAGTWMLPFDGSNYVETPCEPIDNAAVAPIIDSAAQSQNVSPKVLRAVIDQESGFHPCAMSSRGAKGLMQLMPQTASDFSVRDPFNPRENVEAGAKLLKQLMDRYNGDLSLALAAYNAGPVRVDESGGIPDIPETRDYVASILGKLRAKDPEPPAPPAQKPKPVVN